MGITIIINIQQMQNYKGIKKMIKTIKQQSNGYLVNGSMSVPNEPANRHYKEVQEWIANGGVVEPEFTLDELKIAKVNELETVYNNANELDIAYLNSTFQADKVSQDLIVSVLSAGSVPTGFFWLDKANNQVAMTYAELQGLSGAILTRNQANFIKFQGLKTQVNAATTQAALDKIVW